MGLSAAPKWLRWLRVLIGLTLAGTACVLSTLLPTASMAGGGVFGGTVTLGDFPCNNCSNGSFSGTGDLILGGVTTSLGPYVANWLGAPLAAGFGYSEACLGGQPSGTVPLVGSANGGFSLTGGTLRTGTQTTTGITLTGSFFYHRDAAAIIVTLESLSIKDSSGNTIAANLDNVLVGQSVGAIRWTDGPGECPSTIVNPQTAAIDGLVFQEA